MISHLSSGNTVFSNIHVLDSSFMSCLRDFSMGFNLSSSLSADPW